MSHKPRASLLLIAYRAMLWASLASSAHSEHVMNGLVGHYAEFDERSEATIRDRSGRGNHGTTQGATLLRGAKGTALYFDEGDRVSFGRPADFEFADAVTIAAWVYLTDLAERDHSLIVGRRPHGFGLCQHVGAPYALWYATGWERDYCSALAGRRHWTHVTTSFDGAAMKLYLDGALMKTREPTRLDAVDNRRPFMIGGYGFQGIVAEVRIYSRALTDEEVQAQIQSKPGLSREEIARFLKRQEPPLTNELRSLACALYFDQRIDVVIDLSDLAEVPDGAAVRVELRESGKARPLAERVLVNPSAGGEASTSFAALELPPGEYETRSTLVHADGTAIGAPATSKLTWPESPRWATQAGRMQVLNSLVTELLSVESPTKDRYQFVNPRGTNLGGGWVFISSTMDSTATGKASLIVDSDTDGDVAIVHDGGDELTVEAMCHLPAGKHKLTIRREAGAAIKHLVVRSIPELMYCRFPNTPSITQYGPYNWGFLRRHVQRNTNAINGLAHSSNHAYMREWRAMGKRWVDTWSLPRDEPDAPLTGDRAYDYWAKAYGYKDPGADGTLVDEVHGGTESECKAWNEAIRRLHQDFPTKVLYFYGGTILGHGGLMQTLMDCGFAFSWERYLAEPPTEYAARQLVWRELKSNMQAWQAEVPGCQKNIIVNFGHWMSSVPETIGVDPRADFRVYMDMQFNLLANDPDFFGLYGVELFCSVLADQELVHWGMKLFRHYCIEGKTSMLTHTSYVLPHLQDPDFDEWGQGWALRPAEEGSMEVRFRDAYGLLQGRWYGALLPPENGNHFMWTRRSARRANAFSQEVRNLQPGRLYSLKMITANYQDLSVSGAHAVSMKVDNVDPIPDKSFRAVVKQRYHTGLGYSADKNPAWFNYHLSVFRAKAETAMLTVSDWANDNEPGGAVGQEIIYNFFELQPFYDVGEE